METTLLPFTLILLLPLATSITFNLADFGAKPDGRTDATKAFTAAWEKACASSGASVIHVPLGRYLIRNAVVFSGDYCKFRSVNFKILGTLIAPADYRVLANSVTWLSFVNVAGVSISGGTVDGQGAGLWGCKSAAHGGCPDGFTNIAFTNSKNIAIKGLRSVNSQLYHIVINGCKNVEIKGVTIIAPGSSPNTDGIHVQYSRGVTILDSRIGTGDDCISVGAATSNLWIEGIQCGPGHGISIGSLGKEVKEPGVQNVTVTASTFTGTENGVRIKTWGRPSNGFVNKVVFQHLTMVNVQNPIIVDQNYCPDNKGCPGKVSGVRISDVTYRDIHGTSATPVAVSFDCSSKYPCQGIKMENVKLTYNVKEEALASCTNVAGSASGFVIPKSCL